MSPNDPCGGCTQRCFPRVSGDEPADGDILITWEKFSPRERG